MGAARYGSHMRLSAEPGGCASVIPAANLPSNRATPVAPTGKTQHSDPSITERPPMLIFWKERLAYLAVPKTGSTALHRAMGGRASMAVRQPTGLKHAQLFRFERWVKPYLESQGGTGFETMAVVRHPVDWLGSWYRYRARPEIDGHPNSTKDISFDGFVQAWCQDKPPDFARVGSQARFCQNRAGQMGIDHLFRYDAHAALDQFLTDRLGAGWPTQRHNTSPSMPLHLSPATRQLLSDTHPQDFALWEQARH